MFMIIEIKHGWFDFQIPSHLFLLCAPLVGYDFLKELLLVLKKLSRIEMGTKYVAIEDEPAACTFILRKKEN